MTTQSLIVLLFKIIQEAIFGKSAIAIFARRNKIAALFAGLMIGTFVLFLYVAMQAIHRSVALDAQIKTTAALQQHFVALVPPGTPIDKAPQIIVRTLLENEYEYKQCREEVTALRELLSERATQETSTNLKNLLKRLKENEWP